MRSPAPDLQRWSAYLPPVVVVLWWFVTTFIPQGGVRMTFSREILVPIPWMFWVGMGLYAVMTAVRCRVRLVPLLASGVLLGVPLHLTWVILEQYLQLHTGRLSFSSVVYEWYLQGFTAVWLFGVGIWSLRILRRVADGAKPLATRRAPMDLCVPLVHGTVLAVLAWHHAWLLVGCGLGPLLGWVRQVDEGTRGMVEGLQRLWQWLQKPARALWIIGFVALGIRLFYLSRILSDPAYLQTGSDGPWYDEMARQWNGGTLAERPGVGSVGYIYFLGLFYRFVGEGHVPVLLAQVGLGAGVCLILYLLARDLMGQRVALLVAAIASLDFSLIFSSVAIGHQALDVVLSAVGLYGLLRFQRAGAHPWVWLVLSAAVIGFGGAAREPSLLFLLFVPLWLLGRQDRARRWRLGLAHAIVFLSVALAVGGSLLFSSVSSGANIYFSQEVRTVSPFKHADAIGALDWNPVADPQGAWVAFQREPLKISGALAETVWMRVASMLFGQSYGRMDPVFLVRESGYYFTALGYAYLCLLLGIVVWCVRPPIPRASAALLLGFLWWRLLPHLVFESGFRYRAPLEPVLIVLAVSGAVWGYRALKRAAVAGSP